MLRSIEDLRIHAISQSLFQSTTLKAAIDHAAFIQADPIRAPAMAQDLILRHRIEAYNAGDLEHQYPSLNIEEGFLYAYGFLSRLIWHLAHPQNTVGMSEVEKRVLDRVRMVGETHPRDLAVHFGHARAINQWGGYSTVTSLALEALHSRGLLRVARREKGIRVYEPSVPPVNLTSPMEALSKLVLVIASILAPAPEKSLREAVSRLRRLAPYPKIIRATLVDLIHRGELHRQVVDGIAYVWPSDGTVPQQEQHLDNLRRKGPPARSRNNRVVCSLGKLFCLKL